MWFWGVQIIRYYPPHMMSAPTPLNAHPHSYQGASSVVPVQVNGREAGSQVCLRRPRAGTGLWRWW